MVAPKMVFPVPVVVVVNPTVFPETVRSPAAVSVDAPVAVSAAVNALMSFT